MENEKEGKEKRMKDEEEEEEEEEEKGDKEPRHSVARALSLPRYCFPRVCVARGEKPAERRYALSVRGISSYRCDDGAFEVSGQKGGLWSLSLSLIFFFFLFESYLDGSLSFRVSRVSSERVELHLPELTMFVI